MEPIVLLGFYSFKMGLIYTISIWIVWVFITYLLGLDSSSELSEWECISLLCLSLCLSLEW